MMTDFERLQTICEERLQSKNLGDYESRLRMELNEIKSQQSEATYLLKLHDRNVKAQNNEHNSLVPYLLDICEAPDLSKGPAFTEPQYPDIDIDYLPIVRDYLKEKFVINTYGEDYVCNIASYNTFGLKSSLIDMARVFGEDRNEILSLTTRLGMKDDEGDPLSWDKAMELYPDLNDYCDKHEDTVADAAKNLLYGQGIDWDKFGYGHPPHRNRGMGQHASGLIISGQPLKGFVPLVRGKGGLPASAWVEGLASTDLTSVGLIKFDFLSLEANNKIAACNKLIMERHGLESICALPGQPNWSDTSYLEDPDALAMANKGDLKAIFQFDSDGIRAMVRQGGVSCWDDLAAYAALYRPGPMDVGMHDAYIRRKHGEEEYEIHPALERYLRKTYGILVYQEQVMQYVGYVGQIPEAYLYDIIKAISKKKVEKFKKFREQFIENGQKTLGLTRSEMAQKWEEVESFAGYGFNASHTCSYTYISSRQLWQKAHYPLEFFTSNLASLKTGDDRIKEHIQDARRHRVKIERVDLNKSKEDFSIHGDGIYYGFGKIKGIGEEAAKRIVAGQPYANFEDFLKKFGTDAKTVQALVALGVFTEADPYTLYQYYEQHKDCTRKRQERRKRYEASTAKYKEELRTLAGPTATFDDCTFSLIMLDADAQTAKQLQKLKNKYDSCVNNYQKKCEADRSITLDTFDKDGVSIDREFEKMLKDRDQAEEAYMGFQWIHPVEKAPDYDGNTFALVKSNGFDPTDPGADYPLEVLIKEVYHRTSKSGRPYHTIRAEDASSQVDYVTVWDEDYTRFADLLDDSYEGRVVRLRVSLSKPPFNGLTLKSYPRWSREKVPAREFDSRVVVLVPGKKKAKARRVIEVEEFVD